MGRQPVEIEMAKRAGTLMRSVRYLEIQRFLFNRDLTFPAFVELAFDQQDIERIDVLDLTTGRNTPKEKLIRGVDGTALEEQYAEQKAYLEFRPIMAKEFRGPADPDIVIHRIWDWRDKKDIDSHPDYPYVKEAEAEVEEDQREDREFKRIYRILKLKLLAGQSNQGDAAAQKALVEMQAATTKLMADIALRPQTGGETNAIITLLMKQNDDQRNELRELLRERDRPKDPDRATKVVDSVLAIVEKGMQVRDRLPGAEEPAGESTVAIVRDIVQGIAEGIKPILPDVVDIWRGRQGAPIQALANPEGGTTVRKASPEQERAAKEAGERLTRALRDNAYANVDVLLRLNLRDVWEAIHDTPEADAAISLATLELFVPECKQLELQWAGYVQWVQKREEEGE